MNNNNTAATFTNVVLSESVGQKIRPALLMALDENMPDGQRLNALNGMVRILKGVGLDAHALVDTIGKIPTADFKYAMQQQAAKIRAEEQAKAQRMAKQQVQLQVQQHQAGPDWLKIAKECRDHRENRKWINSDGEVQFTRDFADKMVRRLECGDRPSGPTEGEQRYLKRIYRENKAI
jgi:hypothetical protein